MARTLFIRTKALAILALAFVLLHLAGVAVAAPASRFASVAPGVEVSPPPGEMIESGQSIQVRLSGDLALPGSSAVQGWFDPQAATVVRDGPAVILTAPPAMAGGLHNVRLLIPAMVGKPREVTWSIQMPAPVMADPRDAGVTVAVNAKRTLYEGDALVVTVTGPPRGRATATQGNFSFPLNETAPGQYSGRHRIMRSDLSQAAPTRVLITLPDGRVVGNRSESDVKVFGRMFSVRIESPASGSRVPYNFVIRGRTRPHARVSISPRIGVADSPAMQSGTQNLRPSSTTGQTLSHGMGGYDVQADAEGYFEQKFGFPIQLFDISYSFLITARDNEELAVPCTLYVTLTHNLNPTPATSPSPQSPGKSGPSTDEHTVPPYR